MHCGARKHLEKSKKNTN